MDIEELCAVGGHSSEAVRKGEIKIKPGTKKPPNPAANQPYEAEIQIKDSKGNYVDKGNSKGGKSTMFPENWDKKRIMEEVAYAFQNKEHMVGNIYEGKSTTGFTIQFKIDNNNIFTAYPTIK